MLESTEIRWFFKGKIPDNITREFNNGIIPPTEEPDREDLYFKQGSENIGIKLRQGKIEIKQLLVKEEDYRITEKICGNIETWRKWSFNICEEDNEYVNLFQNNKNSWKGILKNRKLKKYEITREKAQPVSTDEFPSEGCGFELTSLITEKENYYTLGLEAFGTKIKNKANLLLTLNYILQNEMLPSLNLSFENSQSYPEWLKIVNK